MLVRAPGLLLPASREVELSVMSKDLLSRFGMDRMRLDRWLASRAIMMPIA